MTSDSENSRLGLWWAAGVLAFAVFFVVLTGIGDWIGEFTPELRLRLWLLGGVVAVAVVVAAVWGRAVVDYEARSPWLRQALLVLAAVVLGYTVVSNWIFNLDDKWVYYRTSLNALRYGLPYWNPEDSLNINSSFLWPYLTALGHVVGSWDLFSRAVGLVSVGCCAALAWWTIQDRALRVVAAVGVVLYYPLVLWSIGGLETAFAAAYLALAVHLLVRLGRGHWLPWVMLGGVFLIRPDTVLIGTGAWLVLAIGRPTAWRENLRSGVAFAAPILAFLAFNYFMFGRLMPSPYYVKGWNKAFSGIYPLHVDIQVGLTHLGGGLAVSILLTAVVLLAVRGLVRARDLRSSHAAVALGALVHIGYVVGGGYQHMNFAFRYFIPSLVPLFYVAALWLDQNAARVVGQVSWRRTASALVLVGLTVQVPLSAFVAYYGVNRDVALTRSELRDRFSVASYAQFMEDWMKAGPYMQGIAKKGERLFLYQDLAGAAIADVYTLDQFYAPMQTSANESIRTCPYVAKAPADCFDHFDYIFSFADPKFVEQFKNHDVLKKYSNLWILRRRN